MRGDAPSSARPHSPEEVVERIRAGGPALVALSGGVDSAAVAYLASRALGPRAVAATVVSTAVSTREVESARAVAQALGLRHLSVEAEPLTDERYRANGADRCYRCRGVEGRALRERARQEGLLQRLDGIHRDDLGDDRPGIRAMEEAGFVHPLLDAGWGKAEVRRFARAVDLPNWDRPSNACLASRVARGEPITAALLARIAHAEDELLDRGFRRVRVRVRGGGARVEVDPAEVDRLLCEPLKSDVVGALERLGFSPVTVDPLGGRPLAGLPVLP